MNTISLLLNFASLQTSFACCKAVKNWTVRRPVSKTSWSPLFSSGDKAEQCGWGTPYVGAGLCRGGATGGRHLQVCSPHRHTPHTSHPHLLSAHRRGNWIPQARQELWVYCAMQTRYEGVRVWEYGGCERVCTMESIYTEGTHTILAYFLQQS